MNVKKYENQLNGLDLWSLGAWNKLIPLESTINDVLEELDAPDAAVDNNSQPYYKDFDCTNTMHFAYCMNKLFLDKWEILIYFTGEFLSNRYHFPKRMFNRVLSVNFILRKEDDIVISDDTMKKTFNKNTIDWTAIIYSDNTGLQYICMENEENQLVLTEVVYGPSEISIKPYVC